MKKKILGMIAAGMSVFLLAGCSSEAEKTLNEMKVEKYVTLGEYKNLEIAMSAITVDEAEVYALVNDVYVNNVTAEYGGITDRAVANGDTVIIDYEGKKDGVAFQGGTAQGASLTIGSGQFIDGFEASLVDVMPGETVDLNLTFPENYDNTDLAGQPVVFTVTVHYILPTEVPVDKMQDEVVRLMGIDNVNTVDELVAFANDYLYTNAETEYQSELEDQLLDQLIELCEYKKIPNKLQDSYRTKISENLQESASYYGMDVNSFTNAAYGLSSEEAIEKYSLTTMKQELALQAIANAEGLKITDEELDARILEWAVAAGYTTVDEYIGDIPKEDYRNYFMSRDVLELLKENANIIEE